MPDTDFTVSVGTPGGNARDYEIRVNGFIYPHGDSLEFNDKIENGHIARGFVKGAWDSYDVRGHVLEISVPGGAKWQLDGDDATVKEILNYRPSRVTTAQYPAGRKTPYAA